MIKTKFNRGLSMAMLVVSAIVNVVETSDSYYNENYVHAVDGSAGFIRNEIAIPDLTIISKKRYESNYRDSIPFQHIIRLKNLNLDKHIPSVEESIEEFNKLNYPNSPARQAYRLYSGSFLIVHFRT